MKGGGTKSIRLAEELIWIGIGLALIFWILESAIHVVIFHDGGFFDQITCPPAHEIWMRLVVVSMFIAFAAYAQFMISRRKRAEHAVKLAHAELDQIFQTAADGMRVIDRDFNVLRVNDTFVMMSGVSKAEAIGKKCHEVFHGPLCDTQACPLTKIIAGKERVEYDAYKERKDGKKVPCIVTATAFRGPHGELLGIVEDFKDITERKQAEEALAESEAKYSTLVENSLTGIYIDQDERIVFANRRLAEIYGYSLEEVTGIESSTLVHPDDRVLTDEMRTKRLGGEEVPLEYEARGMTKNGEIIWVVRRNTRIDYGGRPAILGNVVDITKRKQVEEEKKRLEALFRQAQRMEAIGTLAGGIAHDFNNLLMGIQGRTSLMSMDIDSGHPHLAHLKGIEDAVERGAYLSKQLLGFARGGKYEIKATDLNELIKKSSEMFGMTKKEISIHRKCQEEIWPVEVDQGQIEQVLLNLYVNAWQAMPEGGDLYLETQNVTFDKELSTVFNVKPGDYVKLTVTDTGVGMDDATRERVFEPFFTTKEMGGGTGLGLASSYGIINNHGGVITVRSEPGRGSTFDVYLPASDKEVAIVKEPSTEVVEGTETVFLVDDERMILSVGKEMLAALGYKVMAARSGQEAVAFYKENSDKIDMVILDMIMPDMGGGEVYDKLKEINPNIKALLSSGYTIEGEAHDILQRGCDGFIQKPFTMLQLSSKLRDVLDKP